MIKFEFYCDEDTKKPHFENHCINFVEIDEFFNETVYFELRRKDKSFVAYSKLKSGRYLQVYYRKKSKKVFLSSAYDIENKNIIKFW